MPFVVNVRFYPGFLEARLQVLRLGRLVECRDGDHEMSLGQFPSNINYSPSARFGDAHCRWPVHLACGANGLPARCVSAEKPGETPACPTGKMPVLRFFMPPVLEPTPPSLARQFYRRRAKVPRSQSRRILRLAIVAFVLIFGWTAWYLAKRGFG